VYDVAFSPDGQRLATAHEDGSVMVHEATPWQERGDPGSGAPSAEAGGK
jgi:hypothetical protein